MGATRVRVCLDGRRATNSGIGRAANALIAAATRYAAKDLTWILLAGGDGEGASAARKAGHEVITTGLNPISSGESLHLSQLLADIRADVFYTPLHYVGIGRSVPWIASFHDLAVLRYPEFLPTPAEVNFTYGNQTFDVMQETIRSAVDLFGPRSIHKLLDLPKSAQYRAHLSERTRILRAYILATHLVSVHRSALVHTCSRDSARDILHSFPGVKRKLRVVPNFLDPHFENRRILPYEERLPSILFVSKWSRRKNIELLIDVAAELMEVAPSYIVNCVGKIPKGDYYSDLQARALRVTNIRLLGEVTDQELAKLYQTALAGIVVSHHEGFSLPCIEAGALGTPVLARGVGAINETNIGPCIVDSTEGAREIAVAIERATSDRDHWESLHAQALRNSAAFSASRWWCVWEHMFREAHLRRADQARSTETRYARA